MRRCLFIAMALLLGSALTLPAAASQAGQKDAPKAKPAAKQDRLDGTVHMIDPATKMITVRTRGKTEQRQVMYDDKTAFTFRNKPAKLEEVKEGRRVIVLGKTNDKNVLVATRVDVRDEK
jgi:Cu/Ag efflux protein CusF